ncbi:hypothetical protein PR048_024930 [Dryococelus australis]|uniref:Ribosomal protein S3 n=1 Tax=Dryococelus australis TaxID=614101 RepID=A0ABQ9GQ04_9NEOP|nr:hypothetical protein PR048_024930 [Dryococelus australis]
MPVNGGLRKRQDLKTSPRLMNARTEIRRARRPRGNRFSADPSVRAGENRPAKTDNVGVTIFLRYDQSVVFSTKLYQEAWFISNDEPLRDDWFFNRVQEVRAETPFWFAEKAVVVKEEVSDEVIVDSCRRRRFRRRPLRRLGRQRRFRFWGPKRIHRTARISKEKRGRFIDVLQYGPSLAILARTILRARKQGSKKHQESTRRCPGQLGISWTSLHFTLRKDLRFCLYKINGVQHSQHADYRQRLTFALRIQELSRDIYEFIHKRITSDEVHFQLDGFTDRNAESATGDRHQEILGNVPLTVEGRPDMRSKQDGSTAHKDRNAGIGPGGVVSQLVLRTMDGDPGGCCMRWLDTPVSRASAASRTPIILRILSSQDTSPTPRCEQEEGGGIATKARQYRPRPGDVDARIRAEPPFRRGQEARRLGVTASPVKRASGAAVALRASPPPLPTPRNGEFLEHRLVLLWTSGVGDAPASSYWRATLANPSQWTVSRALTTHLPPRRTGFDSRRRSLQDFRMWKSRWTMLMVDGFSRGSPISPTPAFRRCLILTSLHNHRLSRPRYEAGCPEKQVWRRNRPCSILRNYPIIRLVRFREIKGNREQGGCTENRTQNLPEADSKVIKLSQLTRISVAEQLSTPKRSGFDFRLIESGFSHVGDKADVAIGFSQGAPFITLLLHPLTSFASPVVEASSAVCPPLRASEKLEVTVNSLYQKFAHEAFSVAYRTAVPVSLCPFPRARACRFICRGPAPCRGQRSSQLICPPRDILCADKINGPRRENGQPVECTPVMDVPNLVAGSDTR